MIVKVCWVDSFATTGWDYNDINLPVCQHVGFLHKRKRDRYVIARGYSDCGPEGLFAIPRGCIQNVEVIEL